MDGKGLLIFLLLAVCRPALGVRREFHFVNQLKTWPEAQSYCREKFSDLVTIEDTDDFNRLTELTPNSVSYVWIGMYDDVKSWRWSLDGMSLYEQVYGSWFIFNIQNYLNAERCVAINNGKLYDTGCGASRPSVCYDETTNSYIKVTAVKTWQLAQSHCRQTHTDLASIRDQQELDSVMSVVDAGVYFWVGLSRDGWKWSDQSNSSFREWASNEPDGGDEICGVFAVDGLYGDYCDVNHPFFCAAPQRKVLKVLLKTDGSVNLNTPTVQEVALKQMEKALRRNGVSEEVNLSWREQPHGLIFNKTEL